MNILKFLDKSYTSYHATANAVAILESNGFVDLTQEKLWNIEEGGKYFVTNNDSSVLAFVVGDLSNYAFNICASHTDSPSLKVKGDITVVGNGVTRLNVEKYGGGIMYSFMDRPLKVAGRVFTKGDNGIECQLYDSPFSVVVPSLAIHHNPTVNEGININAQVDMLPILCEGEKNSLYSVIGKDIIDADLYVVPSSPAVLTGIDSEFVTSARIDNLTSVYASINAIVDAKPSGIAVCYCSDNEEIGSSTRQGADSNFLYFTLKRINKALGRKSNDFANATANGMVLSIDNGHAVHPAHPEKSDITNKVFMNKGIVLKHNPNYATDGHSSAVLKYILDCAGIAYQDYYNRSDLRCGSTVGCIIATQLNMSVCDIGLAQLAMHSAAETVGQCDIALMQDCAKAFFNTSLSVGNMKVDIE